MQIDDNPNLEKEPSQADTGQLGSNHEDRLPFSPMAGCLLAIVIALIGGVLIFQIGRLMYFGEIRLGGPELAPNRVWLVREAENAGLSLSRSSVVSGSLEGQQVCLETRIWSLFWRRDDSQSVAGYCLCYQRGDGRWHQSGQCPIETKP